MWSWMGKKLILFQKSFLSIHSFFGKKTKIYFLDKKMVLSEILYQRIIDGLGLIRLFFWFPERWFWASSVVHVVSVQ